MSFQALDKHRSIVVPTSEQRRIGTHYQFGGRLEDQSQIVPFCGSGMPRKLSKVSASVGSAAAVVGYPGCLQLDYRAGRVVHLRYRQAEPVLKPPEPFGTGPGDRLFRLSPVREADRAGGGARHRYCINCGPAAGAFMSGCGAVPVHGGLLGGLAGHCRAVLAWYRPPVSSPGLASLWRGARGMATRATHTSATSPRPPPALSTVAQEVTVPPAVIPTTLGQA